MAQGGMGSILSKKRWNSHAGIITDRDFAIKVAAKGNVPLNTPVEQYCVFSIAHNKCRMIRF